MNIIFYINSFDQRFQEMVYPESSWFVCWNLQQFSNLDFNISDFVPDVETFDWTLSKGHHRWEEGDAEIFKTVLVGIGEDSAKLMSIRYS